MESELQRILEGSILTDALEFIFPVGLLEVEDVSLEDGLVALLQADGQLHSKTPFVSDEYFSPLHLDSSPFANVEELLKQEPLDPLKDYEGLDLSSLPSSSESWDASVDDYAEAVPKPYVEFSGSVDTSPRSCYESMDVNHLVEDPWDLEDINCHFPNNFNWDNFQNEMFLNEDVVSEPEPILKKGSLSSRSSSSRCLSEKETKKSALRGVKKSSHLKIKREQNKVAASRYRTKKKDEEACVMQEYEELMNQNKKLKQMALDKEQEVKVLRKLLKDVLRK